MAIISTAASIIAVFILLIIYVYYNAIKLPSNNPHQHLRKPRDSEKQIIVFVGDSITHGRVGADYVKKISQHLNQNEYEIINAGKNSELAWNLLNRIDQIIECQPNYVFILIGTNDANATLSKKNTSRYIKSMKLPQTPDIDWYKENLLEIIDRLKIKTQAKVVLISLPTIGESAGNIEFNRSEDFSIIIKRIAEMTEISYIPLNETMSNLISEKTIIPKYSYNKSNLEMIKAIVKYYLLRKSWDEISQLSGFKYHIDYLHLNNKGATILAELIIEFLENN
ncbi:MAG: SGNH/GDSL hydrolase family protein [Candidatus Kariarchaeaceae archaeon]